MRRPQLSFFAFQDIIMAVSGVMIIIVLFLSLKIEIDEETANPESPPTPPVPLQIEMDLANKRLLELKNAVEARRRETEDLTELPSPTEDEIAALGREIATLEATLNQQGVLSLEQRTELSRENPLVVTIDGQKLTTQRFDLAPPESFALGDSTSTQALIKALKQEAAKADYLAFYVKPSGVEVFISILAAIKRSGIPHGYHPLIESGKLQLEKN